MAKKPKPKPKPTKPRKYKPKKFKKGGKGAGTIRAHAKACYVCPVDGRSIGRMLILDSNNRWLCECPYDGYRWYAPASLTA